MYRIVKAQDAIVRPWKNGRGETREIALFPSGADFGRGDFLFRVSRASVVEDGPFSTFRGFHRTLVVLDGSGLAIDHGPAETGRVLLPLEPYGFEGEWPTSARLLGSSVSDFNVMVARDRFLACVRIVDGRAREVESSRSCEHALLYVVAGRVGAIVRNASAIDERSDLESGDCLWIERSAGDSSPQRIAIEGIDAQSDPIFVAIFVQIEPKIR